jgi:hypothetical protein
MLLQEQTGGMHDTLNTAVFSAVTLRGEVIKRIMDFLGESRLVIF